MSTNENHQNLILESEERDNIFRNCLDLKVTQSRPFYYIGNNFGNTLNVISIDSMSNKIYSYSNEWEQ